MTHARKARRSGGCSRKLQKKTRHDRKMWAAPRAYSVGKYLIWGEIV